MPCYLTEPMVIGLGGVITIIAIPAVIGYLEFTFMPASADFAPPALAFLTAGAVLALQLVFNLSTTLTAGTFFSSRAPVIGIAIAVLARWLFLQGVLPSWLMEPTPWMITLAATAIPIGNPTIYASMIATEILIPIFIAIGIWRFRREEL